MKKHLTKHHQSPSQLPNKKGQKKPESLTDSDQSAPSFLQLAVLIIFLLPFNINAQSLYQPNLLPTFQALIYDNQQAKEESLSFLKENWLPSHVPLLLDIIHLTSDDWLKKELVKLLKDNTKQKHGSSYFNWLQWLWNEKPVYPYYYADFKASLYRHLDPKFETYFADRNAQTIIRLDEVVWGGVKQDGIPPLRYPKMFNAVEANYLADSDIVFGIFINGQAKAYPKRILGWHELFVDEIGGKKIAGVYCTLCGTVIAYLMEHKGITHDLGTSGFLYRSNKLMYDAATQSLWSTIEGKPVVGPLINQGIELATFPVVTTTWGAWKQAHPQTKVLSLDTGHQRDYKEGAAYKDYFATDQLMFPVPESNYKLENKAEVLIIRLPGYQQDPLAISITFLKRKRLYNGTMAGTAFLVIAEKDGAARVFERKDIEFESYKKGVLKDAFGNSWIISENELSDGKDIMLKRIPAHNIFWFAWYNAYPGTRLVK